MSNKADLRKLFGCWLKIFQYFALAATVTSPRLGNKSSPPSFIVLLAEKLELPAEGLQPLKPSENTILYWPRCSSFKPRAGKSGYSGSDWLEGADISQSIHSLDCWLQNRARFASPPTLSSVYAPILMAVAVSSFRPENTIDFRRLINHPKPLLCKR